MFLIINSISQAHLENQVTLLLGCVFSAISTRINSHKTFQSAAFFFSFEPKCHSKLFMTTSLVVRVLPFAMNRKEQRSGPFEKEDIQLGVKAGARMQKKA